MIEQVLEQLVDDGRELRVAPAQEILFGHVRVDAPREPLQIGARIVALFRNAHASSDGISSRCSALLRK